MIPSYNLLEKPWIPVRLLNGVTTDMSLTNVLLRAQDIATLTETSPPNLMALYRLLLAIIHRALVRGYGRWSDLDRVKWFREGLPTSILRDYLEDVHDRFWLFHPDTPFMQVPALKMDDRTRDHIKPVSQIQLEAVVGNAPVLFDHSLDDAPRAIEPAQACRSLLGFLQCTPGGLVKVLRSSDKAGPLADTAAVLPLGQTLQQTLVFALHPYDENDLPSWELPIPKIGELEGGSDRLATGPNDRYSRLTRSILLERDTDGLVRGLHYAAGIALKEDPQAPDPMAAFTRTKKNKPIRIRFSEGRAIWRDLPALLPESGGDPPLTLVWARQVLARLNQWDAFLPVLVGGLASNKAKLERWRLVRIELPERLLLEPDRAHFLRQEVERAEALYRDLCLVLERLIAETLPQPEHKDSKKRAQTIREKGPFEGVFFSSLEHSLPQILTILGQVNFDAARERVYMLWTNALREASLEAWEATQYSLGVGPSIWCAIAKTEPLFFGCLRSHDILKNAVSH